MRRKETKEEFTTGCNHLEKQENSHNSSDLKNYFYNLTGYQPGSDQRRNSHLDLCPKWMSITKTILDRRPLVISGCAAIISGGVYQRCPEQTCARKWDNRRQQLRVPTGVKPMRTIAGHRISGSKRRIEKLFLSTQGDKYFAGLLQKRGGDYRCLRMYQLEQTG